MKPLRVYKWCDGEWYDTDEADAVIRELDYAVESLEVDNKKKDTRIAELERDLKTLAEASRNRIAQLEAEIAQLRITAEVASRHLMRERDDAEAERDEARADAEKYRAALLGLAQRVVEADAQHVRDQLGDAIDAARRTE